MFVFFYMKESAIYCEIWVDFPRKRHKCVSSIDNIVGRYPMRVFERKKKFYHFLKKYCVSDFFRNFSVRNSDFSGFCYVQEYCSVTLIRVNKHTHRLVSSLVI